MDNIKKADAEIKGELLHFSTYGNFVYNYVCERCHGVFRETSPEISAPALCHSCYSNRKIGKTKRQYTKE